MSDQFDPLGFIGDVANGVGGAAQAAVNAVGDGLGAAANAVGEGLGVAANTVEEMADAAVGAVDGLLHPAEQEKKDPPQLPPRYSADMQREGLFLFPKSIVVHRVSRGPKGEPREGRGQALYMSKEGVSLLASTEVFAPEVEKLSISNCLVFKDGKTEGANPLLSALGITFACTTNPANSPILGLIAFICSLQGSDKWYLYVLEHDGKEHLFRIGSESDGDELIEFLDTYMLPM